MRDSPRELGSRGLTWAFLALVGFGVFAVGNLATERVLGRAGPACILAGLAALGALVVVSFFAEDAVTRFMRRGAEGLVSVTTGPWLTAFIGVGWALRIVWVVVVPPVQKSDMGAYFGLARSLVERGIYEYHGFRVLYPPGLPLFLWPTMKLFGPTAWLPLLNNLLLFAGTVAVVLALARRLAGEGAARLASLLLVFWPNHIMLVGLAAKELLLLFLVSLAALLIVRASDAQGAARAGWGLVGGLAIGASVLTQPATIALLPAFLLFFAWHEHRPWEVLSRSAVLVAGAVLVVMPWTLRNYRLFGAVIPVSANSGQPLFVGNNPEATGGYIPVERRYADLDEVSFDRFARRTALNWIGENPRRFLALMPRKQILFLGDSADGPYWAVKENLGITDLRYVAAKGLANAYWLGVLALMAISVCHHRHSALGQDPHIGLQMLFFLFFFALFSVTESGGRQHICLSGFSAILASLGSARRWHRVPAEHDGMASPGKIGSLHSGPGRLGD